MKRIIVVTVALMVALMVASPVNASTKKCKVQKCTTITKLMAVDKVATEPKTKAKKHKAKAKKYKVAKAKIECPNCGGTSHNCPYWVGDRHMTTQETKEYEWLEWHYLADDGQWYELRTGNTEPVEKPDYVTRW